MATRSVIAKLDDKGVKAIYCHSDGYLSNNGKILDKNYTDCSKLNELLADGDISSLKDTIKDTIFYNRDRGEKTLTSILKDEKELLEHAFEYCDAEYVYMFTYGTWYVYDNAKGIGDCSYKFIELEEALYTLA